MILGCDGLPMLLTLGISVISTTFVTRFLFLVLPNTAGVILLLDLRVLCFFGVGYTGTVILLLLLVLLSVTLKSTFVQSPVKPLVNSCIPSGLFV